MSFQGRRWNYLIAFDLKKALFGNSAFYFFEKYRFFVDKNKKNPFKDYTFFEKYGIIVLPNNIMTRARARE